MTAENRSRLTKSLIASAILSQLFSFATKCFGQIDHHGTAYSGMARHLRQGEFHSDINAFSLGDGSILSQGILQFAADVQNAQDRIATWSASDGAINSTGLFAAPRVVTSQQVMVTAASKEDPTKSAQAIQAVTPPPRSPLHPPPNTRGRAPYKCSRTDLLPAPLPATPKVGNLVGAGTCIRDPDFGSRVCRITDSTTNPSTMVSGYGGDGDRNEFNTDSTKLFVETVNGPVYPMNFDPVTMTATRMYASWGLSVVPAWSHVNKDVFYGITATPFGTSYLKYDTSSPSIPIPATVADFKTANCLGTGFIAAYVFNGGVSSDDTIFIAGFSNNGGQGGSGAKYVVTYNSWDSAA